MPSIPAKNLAEPAPIVESAKATSIGSTEPATADAVGPSEAIQVGSALPVEPATTVDCAMDLAPPSVQNPTKIDKKSLSVSQLREGTGVDLETYAAVIQGAPSKNWLQKWAPIIYDERDFVTYGEVKKYILIKNGVCFVYSEATDLFPLYTVALHEFRAVAEDPDKPDKGGVTISPLPNTNKPKVTMITILLKNHKGKQAHQFSFDTERVSPAVPKQFVELVNQAKSPSVLATVMLE